MSLKYPDTELQDAMAASDDSFRKELQQLLNRYSRENGSGTPDFLLAEFLIGNLQLFDEVMQAREKWYGRGPRPVGI